MFPLGKQTIRKPWDEKLGLVMKGEYQGAARFDIQRNLGPLVDSTRGKTPYHTGRTHLPCFFNNSQVTNKKRHF